MGDAHASEEASSRSGFSASTLNSSIGSRRTYVPLLPRVSIKPSAASSRRAWRIVPGPDEVSDQSLPRDLVVGDQQPGLRRHRG